MKNLLKTKTFWTGVSSLLAAGAGYYTGTMDTGTAIQTALAGLAVIFIRDGMISTKADDAGQR
ncbi:MAG: hypothetical protein RBT11_01705 [Desulfobacterales bacterium]|jgi:hypothetical protein|nr:hypothetical protein [Desulfobacterales bacterium]